ncbi:MAG TPA: N-acetylmuramoyl-L-alanine amidase, partial [Arenibacter sp.]|nr:N-acetylmuramoyl-L-alanine amidase [Arenibacter sp.]
MKIFILLVLAGLSLPGFSQDSTRTVIAGKGDGIYSLLRKHGLDPVLHYRHFIGLNKESLRDSIHLDEGGEYILPPVVVDPAVIAGSVQRKTTGIQEVPHILEMDIFGKDHAKIYIKSDKLKGTVYYLTSGHGGPDPGAVAYYEGKMIAEDEYAYDITLRLAKELMSHGAEVYLIIRDPNDGIRDYRVLEIDRDEVVYPNEEIPLNQLERLRQRVEVVNKLYLENKGKYQRLIAIHVDSRSKGENIDVFFYHHEHSKNGKHLAESIHETFFSNYRKYQPNRTYEGTFTERSGLYLVK